jgi:hypothetical protein
MPRRAKAKGLYQRGQFWLDWDKRGDGTLRSPNLAIFWYDPDRGRIRSTTAGTGNEREARKALDRHYLTHTEGAAICPTCGQTRNQEQTNYFVTDAIADYLAMKDDKILGARLAHVLDYIETLPSPAIRCRQINEAWAQGYRIWSAKQPVVFTSGRIRDEPRAASTTENSLIALAAAITSAHTRGDVAKPVQFRPIQTKELNRTPLRRLSIAEIARCFRYAYDPKFPTKRRNLHRFLIASVATVARPDAVHDISTRKERRQWDSDRRVLALNPTGRRQTKKYRATVIVPGQFALHLDGVDGPFVTAVSVRSAWDAMCEDFGWDGAGEYGMKIMRRSIAQLLRDPARGVPTEQLELQLGHRRIDSVTDLYAAFDPAYLSAATAAIEAIIDEVETLAPGAFHRTNTGDGAKIIPMRRTNNAA